jgi:hypothetical protein
MDNSLKKLQAEREAMLPPELEGRVSEQAVSMSFLGNLTEVFLPNALQVMVRLMGGGDLPCLHKTSRRKKRPNGDWRTPPAGPVIG